MGKANQLAFFLAFAYTLTWRQDSAVPACGETAFPVCGFPFFLSLFFPVFTMIHFENVSKLYARELFQKRRPALQDVSFTLGERQTLGLIGANGAGKSTSIRLIMDFIRPTRGTVQVLGRPASDLSYRARIGYLPEVAAFPQTLTVLDLIRFTCTTCGLPAKEGKERGDRLLQDLGLWEARKRRLHTYSKGMQQRANFVLALINNPDLLILDEPMSGLDPLGRGQITALIQQLKEEGKSILFCSHILSDVDRLVDQLLVLDRGSTLFYGPPSEFLAQEQADSIEGAFLARIKKHREEEHAA